MGAHDEPKPDHDPNRDGQGPVRYHQNSTPALTARRSHAPGRTETKNAIKVALTFAARDPYIE